MKWSPPSRFEEYELERLLGAGEMGQVYLAKDALLERTVAVKFITPEKLSEDMAERFLVEARATARVQHPNVATIYRVGQLGERPYLVSEFIEGRPMDELELPLSKDNALILVLGMVRGLAAAHQRGVLHRDLKPGNVIVAADGTPKLVDFGLAKVTSLDSGGRRRPEDGARPSAAETSAAPEVEATGEIEAAEMEPTGGLLRTGDTDATGDIDASGAIDGTGDIDVTGDIDATGDIEVVEPDNRAPARTLTRGLVGTPDYMAPELWRGEAASVQSDLYAVGAVLFELLTGKPPFAEVEARSLPTIVQTRDPPNLEDAPELGRIVASCLSRNPSDRPASADVLRELLEQLRRGAPRRFAGNPYRGLSTFDERHTGLFFGRAADIDAIVERLRTTTVLLVAGDSGIGKSSICRAGVLPELSRVQLEGRSTWSQVTLTPASQPLRSLAVAMSGFLNQDVDDLAARLEEDPLSSLSQLRLRTRTRGIAVLVDQFEELLTLSGDHERQAFTDWLAAAASGCPGLRIVATVRSDFLTRLANEPQLGGLIASSLVLLRPLTPSQLRAVVVGPSEAAGVRFEDEAMVEELVEGTEEGTALPLLQFTLSKLWDARDVSRSLIPRSALEALGGLSGALGQHADTVVAGLRPSEQEAAKEILLSLVTMDRTRGVRSAEELGMGDIDRARVVEALVQGRLLAAREGSRGSTYQLAHDVLIQSWSQLRLWLEQDAQTQEARARLLEATRDWIRTNRSPESLWRASQLRRHGKILDWSLSEDEAAFVKASRRRARRILVAQVLGVISLPLVLGIALFAAQAKVERELNVKVGALVREGRARAHDAEALEAKGHVLRADLASQLNRRERPAAERTWKALEASLVEADDHRRAATNAFEAALTLRPTDPTLRDTLGNALLRRAQLALLRNSSILALELLERLPLYDTTGNLQARLTAPANLTLGPGVDGLSAYTPDDQGRLVPQPLSYLSEAPFPLPPGYYVVSAGEYRLPFLLQPGRPRTLRKKDLVPDRPGSAGFVFIPAGTTVFGSMEDDAGRLGFFDAPPPHEVEMPPFFISRYEVTFAKYLEFVDALPPDQRSGAVPSAGGAGTGGIYLGRTAAGWQIRISPLDTVYNAGPDQLITYPARKTRVEQRWMQWPVLGISARQAEAYARWLDETGRIPGARLCTEREWMRAARGRDRRAFPHGDGLAPDDANFDATYDRASGGMGPDEVGSHPASQSPFGVHDLTGNAIEWTLSSYEADTYVLKGGSYFYDKKTNRLCNRAIAAPTVQLASAGIRLCVSARAGRGEF